MEACSTWECINSFSGWISAIGTILVSALALWLAWKDKILRLSTTFSYGCIKNEIVNEFVWILNFVNKGARPVTVTGFYFLYKAFPMSKYQKLLTFPHYDDRLGYLCKQLPCKLDDGQSGNIFYADDFFAKLDDIKKFIFPDSKILALYRIFTFKIYIDTSFSKRFKTKINLRARKILWDKYRELY